MLVLDAAWSCCSSRIDDHQGLPIPPALAELEEYTAGGERYIHDLSNPQAENGTYVWTYIAWGELRTTWPLRSERWHG